MKALAIIRTAERVAAVSIFLTMVALYSANVLARQVGGTFASEFAWVEEAVRLMSLFLVFLKGSTKPSTVSLDAREVWIIGNYTPPENDGCWRCFLRL